MSAPPSRNMPGGSREAPGNVDPDVVEQILKELKSQGIFDQVRKQCLEEMDTKPAYQNLRQRVETSVNTFLSKESAKKKWTPVLSKTHLRNQLRKRLQEATYMDMGVERIVAQVVGPKVLSVIEPKVEETMYNVLGVERPSEEEEAEEKPEQGGQNQDLANGNLSASGGDDSKHEKLSTISSSEDVEMVSADEEVHMPPVPLFEPPANRPGPPPPPPGAKSSSEEGDGTPDIRPGNISPLTPERNRPFNQAESSSSEDLRPPGEEDEPLTPPMPQVPSPRTPPLPPMPSMPTVPPMPPMPMDVEEQEIILPPQGVQSASPVSEGELMAVGQSADEESPPRTPPMPPLPAAPAPPPPPIVRPPSPIGSPIESSSEELSDEANPKPPVAPPSVSGPSDISDTDLPVASHSEGDSSAESDLETLVKARDELQAQLAATSLQSESSAEPSEGEIRSEDDEDSSKRQSSRGEEAVPAKTEDSSGAQLTSPISDSMSPLEISKTPTTEAETPEDGEEKSSEEENQDKDVKPGKRKRDDDDGPSGSGAGGSSSTASSSASNQDSSASKSAQKGSESSKSDDVKKSEGKSSDGKSHHHGYNGNNSSSSRRRSSTDKEHHRRDRDKDRKHRHHHSSSHRRHSQNHSSKNGKSPTHSSKEKPSDRAKDQKDQKDPKKEKVREKNQEKLAKIEMRIKQKEALRSEKFTGFDMFAPKPPKPKVHLGRPGSSASSTGSSSPQVGRSPLSWGSKTPPAFGHQVKVFAPLSPTVATSSMDKSVKKVASPLPVPVISPSKRQLKREESIEEKFAAMHGERTERKVFPEVPGTKDLEPGTDKLKQHENDVNDVKQRLADLRARKLEEQQQAKRKKSMDKAKTASEKKSERRQSGERESSRKLKKANLERSLEVKAKQPLTMADLEDNEDEVSDWSETEGPLSLVKMANGRQRKRRHLDFSDDSDSDSQKPQTRKSSRKLEADSILASDQEIPEFHGFEDFESDRANPLRALVEEKEKAEQILASDQDTPYFYGFEDIEVEKEHPLRKLLDDMNMYASQSEGLT